eukprot:TRINITY_DN617_c0_g2_i2.p3 TRINITY_DN617_c0_g2~~TRINITY_DN617_c0_g2_i2.p3  ORF type:complete len:215 (+),score=75.35 TRINITY_DN617_c0_g2_i2:63-647(+)
MGRDTTKSHNHKRCARRTSPSSTNPYIYLLVKVYRFLCRRAPSPFNKVMLHRLMMSRTNMAPICVSRLAKWMSAKGRENKIAVVVGPVVDDTRMAECPKLTVAALKFTSSARARITKAGGECLTLDQLAMRQPKGGQTVLLRGRRKARTVYRHFGAPGVPGSHVRPHIPNESKTGRKFERARGRRNSRAFKVKA